MKTLPRTRIRHTMPRKKEISYEKAISRRDFLKVVGVSAAALGMTACGGSSASTSTSTAASSTASSAAAGAGEGGSGNDYKLTWNEVNGEDYGATVGAHTFAEKIEELSGGHITIDLYINGTLGSEAESMQGYPDGYSGYLPRQRFFSAQLRR